MKVVVALDVGGSSVKSALIDATNRQVQDFREDALDSLAGAETILEGFVSILRRAIESDAANALLGVGVGFPGPFDYPNGVCLIQGGSTDARATLAPRSPAHALRAQAGREPDGARRPAVSAGVSHAGGRAKFESIYGIDLRAEWRARLHRPDLPIVFSNDATVALLGEARYGSGRPYRRLIGLTLGTGLGSAFLVDGQPVTEGPGVPRQGWLYAEPYQGASADDSFSARGLRQRWQQTGADYADAKAAAQAARAGARPARQAFEAFGAELGAYLMPYAAAFGAEVVVVMGGLAGAFDLFEQPFTDALGRPVLASTLGPKAALLGAADRLLENREGL